MRSKVSIILLTAFPDKKIKSVGNKALLKLNKDITVIEYQIQCLNKIFKNPQIIVVGGFDGKRLQKHINAKKINNLTYIEHDIGSSSNIGESILYGIQQSLNDRILIYNSNIILNKEVILKLKNITDSSYILYSKKCYGDFGCTIQNNKLVNCFFDMDNRIYDYLYFSKEDCDKFKHLIYTTTNIQKYYLFEIINMCIENSIDIAPVHIPQKHMHILDNINAINSIQKYINKYA